MLSTPSQTELFDRHDLKASWVITVAIHDWLQNLAYVRATGYEYIFAHG